MATSHPRPQQCDHPRSDLPLALTIFRCVTPEERSALAAHPGTENLRNWSDGKYRTAPTIAIVHPKRRE